MARSSRVFSPTAALRRNALYKGLLGGSRGWLAVGAVVWAPRVLKKVLGKNEELVAKEKLHPGQTLCIEALERPTASERRAARRAR